MHINAASSFSAIKEDEKRDWLNKQTLKHPFICVRNCGAPAAITLLCFIASWEPSVKYQPARSKSCRYLANQKYLKVYRLPLAQTALDWKRYTWKIFSPWVTISVCHSSAPEQEGAAPTRSWQEERHPQHQSAGRGTGGKATQERSWINPEREQYLFTTASAPRLQNNYRNWNGLFLLAFVWETSGLGFGEKRALQCVYSSS